MKSNFIKILVLLFVLFLIANLVLFALKIISEIFFWVVIALGAVFAFKIVPKLKSKF